MTWHPSLGTSQRTAKCARPIRGPIRWAARGKPPPPDDPGSGCNYVRHTGSMTATRIPPLVEPAPELTRDEVARYSRHLILPGIEGVGQRRLKNAKVLVVGAGGLGSPVLLYLAAAGVGTIGIVDFDVVDGSNLQRQIIHTVHDLGRLKTSSAADSIAAVNPLVTVQEHQVRLDSANALGLLAHYDLVLDGTDNFATRYLVNDACVLLGKPYIWGSIYRFEGQVSIFWAIHGPQYRDVFPKPPPPGSVPSCAEGGVLGVLCGSIGSIMANEAIKLICGIGRPLIGRILMYDAWEMTYRSVNIKPDPLAEQITELIDYEQWCGAPDSASETAAAGLITAVELRDELMGDNPPIIIDVRLPAEFAIVSLPDATLVTLDQITGGEALSRLGDMAAEKPLVLYCKSGARSAVALAALIAAGIPNIRHLEGGVLAWIDQVDTTLPRY